MSLGFRADRDRADSRTDGKQIQYRSISSGISTPLLIQHHHATPVYHPAKHEDCEFTFNDLIGFLDFECEKKLATINAKMLAVAMLGVSFIIIGGYVCWDHESLVYDYECEEVQYMEMLVWCCALVNFFHLLQYYRIKAEILMRNSKHTTLSDAFFASDLKYRFLLEFIINFLNPLPYFNLFEEYGLPASTALAFLRYYLIVRAIRDYSEMYRHRRTFQNNMNAPGHYGSVPVHYKVDFRAVIKTFFFMYTFASVALVAMLIGLGLSFQLYLVEREWWVAIDPASGLNPVRGTDITEIMKDEYVQTPFCLYGQAIWFTIIQECTLGWGWGQEPPLTFYGQFIALCASATGVMLTSIILGVITNKIAPTPFEDYLIHWKRRKQIDTEKHEFAARIIQLTWMEKRGLRSVVGGMKRVNHFEAIRKWTKAFKNVILQEQEMDMNALSRGHGSAYGHALAASSSLLHSQRDDVSRRLDRIELALTRISSNLEFVRPRSNTQNEPMSPSISPSFLGIPEGASIK